MSLLTTVGIVSVLLFEGVRFFTTDFYQEKRSELTTLAAAPGPAGTPGPIGADGAAAPNALAPGSVPQVSVRGDYRCADLCRLAAAGHGRAAVRVRS